MGRDAQILGRDKQILGRDILLLRHTDIDPRHDCGTPGQQGNVGQADSLSELRESRRPTAGSAADRHP